MSPGLPQRPCPAHARPPSPRTWEPRDPPQTLLYTLSHSARNQGQAWTILGSEKNPESGVTPEPAETLPGTTSDTQLDALQAARPPATVEQAAASMGRAGASRPLLTTRRRAERGCGHGLCALRPRAGPCEGATSPAVACGGSARRRGTGVGNAPRRRPAGAARGTRRPGTRRPGTRGSVRAHGGRRLEDGRAACWPLVPFEGQAQYADGRSAGC